jgi:hypothetical protein
MYIHRMCIQTYKFFLISNVKNVIFNCKLLLFFLISHLLYCDLKLKFLPKRKKTFIFERIIIKL